MRDISEILDVWEPIIGLEVHAQLSTKTKMFCRCKNVYGDPPNTRTCPVCLGLPGALPMANRQAIEFVLKLGLAVGCKITHYSRFARKNYFYPDLPKGYQISQYEEPLCIGGSIIIRKNGKLAEINLTRIHIEEDAGKSLHRENGEGTYVDFNRCGVPLVEIVSEPEIHMPREAKQYLSRLKLILEYLGICDCNMEQGNLRCDANISLRRRGESAFGVKTEMKNLNSFRSVERGLEYEVVRQAGVLEKNGRVKQVTLLWDEGKQRAEVLRSKEEAHDYRYFPDPDLVPISISDEEIRKVREQLIELPHEKEERFAKIYGLRLDDAIVLASDLSLAEYFEKAVGLGADSSEAAKWILGEMLRVLKDRSLDIESFPIKPERFIELLRVLDEGIINTNTAKLIFNKMLETEKPPLKIIESEGLVQVSDTSQLQVVIDEVLANSPDEISRYKQGKKTLFGFFMGQVMKKTEGKSDPQLVKSLLSESLEKKSQRNK